MSGPKRFEVLPCRFVKPFSVCFFHNTDRLASDTLLWHHLSAGPNAKNQGPIRSRAFPVFTLTLSLLRDILAPIMNFPRCFLAFCFAVLIACEDPRNPTERRRERCNALISGYRPALERVFEAEMHAYRSIMPDPSSDWFKAMVAISASAEDSDGRLRDPAEVVLDAVRHLAHMKDGDERRQLEYILLGTAMPLEARKEFEEYCVVSTPGASPY
jgi:hypothetical protein